MARLLIMEDDLDFAAQLGTDLEERGHDVVIFDSATDALVYAEANSFDLAISDIIVKEDERISRDGGIKFISGLRQIQKKSVPIIAISGTFTHTSGATIASSASTVGANILIAKPFFPQELATAIEMLLKRRG